MLALYTFIYHMAIIVIHIRQFFLRDAPGPPDAAAAAAELLLQHGGLRRAAAA